MIRETSKLALESIRKELGKRQEQVYLAIKELRESNNLMISKKLNLAINVVVPRTNELVKMGLVEESYKDKCPLTKRMSIFWKVTNV
jgi:predicted transcriptional regulator